MFFFRSKTLYYLLMPISWISALLLTALLTKKPRLKKRALRLAVIFFLLFSNPFLANEALLLLEAPPVPFKNVGKYEAAVVLTGVQARRSVPADRVYLDRGADRILHTVRLYRAGNIRKIIISGGSGRLTGSKESEAAGLAKVFRLSGIPDQDLILEETSRNTHESAVLVQKIMQEKFPGTQCLLVTSAFHMRRAAGCYKKQGIAFDGFPTDFYSHERTFSLDILLIPSERAFMHWHTIIKELAGILTYKMLGYAS